MVAMAVRVVTALGSAVAALELGPLPRVGLPDLIAPADVHHAKAAGHSELVAVLIGSEEPLQERLSLRVLLGDLGVDHPVEGATFLVLAAATLIAGARRPDVAGVLVRGSDEVGDFLGARLSGRVADVLPLVRGQGVDLCREARRHRGRRREGDLLFGLLVLLVVLGVSLLLGRRTRVPSDGRPGGTLGDGGVGHMVCLADGRRSRWLGDEQEAGHERHAGTEDRRPHSGHRSLRICPGRATTGTHAVQGSPCRPGNLVRHARFPGMSPDRHLGPLSRPSTRPEARLPTSAP